MDGDIWGSNDLVDEVLAHGDGEAVAGELFDAVGVEAAPRETSGKQDVSDRSHEQHLVWQIWLDCGRQRGAPMGLSPLRRGSSSGSRETVPNRASSSARYRIIMEPGQLPALADLLEPGPAPFEIVVHIRIAILPAHH